MTALKNRLFSTFLFLLSGALTFGALKATFEVAHAQTAGSASATESEKQATWNDPKMLRARAWLNDYCKDNDAMSEAEAAAHMQALQSMTPQQMKLFAMTHDAVTKSHPTALAQHAHQQALHHAKQVAASQKWWAENVHKAEAQQALQADQATQKAYSSINQEETAAANEEQSQLNSEQAFARENQASKLDELNNPYPSLGYGNPYYYGGAGTHFHFHMYPN